MQRQFVLQWQRLFVLEDDRQAWQTKARAAYLDVSDVSEQCDTSVDMLGQEHDLCLASAENHHLLH